MVRTSNFTPHTSHSAEGQLRGYPTIPVFYHSTIPRQTNPISGRAGGRTSAVWIRSCDEWDTGDAVEKQTQFRRHGRDARGTHGRDAHATERLAASPRLRGDDIATDTASAPNKPNFGASDLEDKCRVNKELRPIGCTSGPRKTKPIRPGGRVSGVRVQRPTPGARSPGRLYKQTQFLPLCRSGDRRSREGGLCKTNPITRSGAPRRCRPWRPSRAPHYSSIPARCRPHPSCTRRPRHLHVGDVPTWHGLGVPNAKFRVGGPLPAHESSAGCRCHKAARAGCPHDEAAQQRSCTGSAFPLDKHRCLDYHSRFPRTRSPGNQPCG